jgi:tetratricopeptide (TPR) repeat protein
MRFAFFWTAVLVGTALLVATAGAQPSPEWHSCTGEPDVDWDQQIRSCTALIQSDRESVHNRAIAYNFRGNSYYAKGDNDRAITDYNEAVRLDPMYESAYVNRGLSYYVKGDSDLAIAHFRKALQLNPGQIHQQ